MERRRYLAARPEKRKADKKRRKARERGARRAVRVDRAAIYRRDGGICQLCWTPVGFKVMHLDHVVPLAHGGAHEPGNVQIVHPACNLAKLDRLPGFSAPVRWQAR